MTTKTIASGTVADAYLALLADRGIDNIFANAGTDFAPLIEAYAKAQALGTKVPKPVLVPHENVAMHMALGYYLKTGRVQAVMVHVNVGTANAICGLMNANRANLPVFFTAGRTPFTEDAGVMGARTGEIHWPQEMRDQRAMVRELVKWDYELPNAYTMETAVDRALAMAQTEPLGPIYLTLPREVLAQSIDNYTYNSPTRLMPASAPWPDMNAIDRAADMIAKAENPIIVTSTTGKNTADVAKLGALAERFSIPVIQRKPRYVALESDHPMHLGYNPDPYFARADLVIVMDCDVPWIPAKKAPKPDCKVIHIGTDPLFSSYPLRGFACDLAITGATGVTLTALADALDARKGKTGGLNGAIDTRRKTWGAERSEQRAKWAGMIDKAKMATPMSPVWITHCLEQVRGADGIMVKESPVLPEHMNLSQPGTFYSIGAAGALGWGLGTALGLKAAAPDKLVIATCGDGAYMFGNPMPAHYVAKAENLPLLTVVFNNEMWGAVKRNTHEVYPDGYAAKSNREPLTYFEPGTKFEKAVEAVDGHGECVTDPAKLPQALERAMSAIGNGRQAMLNVICRGP